jgi:3-oxoacyl-[acyl-carrier-protein] synthase II
VKAVLFGAVDELCPVLGYSYDRFFNERAFGPIEPDVWKKQSAVMAEGATFLLLTLAEPGRGYGDITQLDWQRAAGVQLDASMPLVLGADGQICHARDYRRLAETHGHPIYYSPLYGSLPGGQAFDIAFATLTAQQSSEEYSVQIVKCDAHGNGGIVTCRFV